MYVTHCYKNLTDFTPADEYTREIQNYERYSHYFLKRMKDVILFCPFIHSFVCSFVHPDLFLLIYITKCRETSHMYF